MSALHLGKRFAGIRNRWAQKHPPCGERDCNVTRRLWRRTVWWNQRIRLHGAHYCAPHCFETVARHCFSEVCARAVSASPVQHRIPLGLLMLSRGQLTYPQLQIGSGRS
jgi:hypothetical protein